MNGFIIFIIVISLIGVLIRNKENSTETPEYEEMNPLYELVSVEADDEFSEKIIYSVRDVFIYDGKNTSDNRTQYSFYFREWTQEDVAEFSRAIKENGDIVEGKAQIIVFEKIGGISIGAFSLDNTSDDSLKIPDFDGFYRLRTNDYMFEGEPSYLLLISSIEGIRKLETTERFMEESERNGIDWYEVWPELEEIVIIDGE